MKNTPVKKLSLPTSKERKLFNLGGLRLNRAFLKQQSQNRKSHSFLEKVSAKITYLYYIAGHCYSSWYFFKDQNLRGLFSVVFFVGHVVLFKRINERQRMRKFDRVITAQLLNHEKVMSVTSEAWKLRKFWHVIITQSDMICLSCLVTHGQRTSILAATNFLWISFLSIHSFWYIKCLIVLQIQFNAALWGNDGSNLKFLTEVEQIRNKSGFQTQ